MDDASFSSGALGKGVSVLPTEGVVVAPFNGEVRVLFRTKHAIGLVSDFGAEVLIHIGIDTVRLEGEYFTTHIEEGQKFKAGQKLVSFDIEKIKEAGYSLLTPILISNTSDYLDVIETTESNVTTEELLLTLIK